jgi:APA family basic amino acid/polyamine antiporter
MADAHARPLGLGSLLALGVNGIVGVGIFFAPAKVAAELPGQAGVLAYALTALALLPIAVVYALLGNRFSVDGGPTVWAEAAIGPRFAFFVGWLTYVSSLFSLAAVASGLAHHAGASVGVTGEAGVRALAVLCVLGLAFVASLGLRLSSVAWTTVTVLKLVPLLVLVVVGVIVSASGFESRAPVTAGWFSEGATAHSMERAVLVVVFACQGFEIVPLLAGSVRRSTTSVPLATVGSLLLASLLYAALHALATHALPELGRAKAPLAEAAGIYGGPSVQALVAAGANVSALGILFGMSNTTPRYLAALSGAHAFGPAIGALDGRLVPRRALWITAVVVAVIVAFGSGLTGLFVLSSLAVLAQYGAAMLSLGILARRRERALSPALVYVVLAAVPGILLAVQGAEAVEILVAAAVVLGGEILRRLVRRGR